MKKDNKGNKYYYSELQLVLILVLLLTPLITLL